VGLSASPGNDKEKIKEIVVNLNISWILFKDEDDDEIRKYMKMKRIE